MPKSSIADLLFSEGCKQITMRRKEKEITKKSEIEAVINKALVCRVGLSDNNFPYIVPLCFGYQDNTIYIHGALEGRKIDILKKIKTYALNLI
ncbi:pyridoxamine 5'-phosphate oxidase family protein [Thermodesulfobacteriota bacterium]